MRIIKKGYDYYEVISETAKFYNAKRLKFRIPKAEDGTFYTKTYDGFYISHGEGTKYTKVYESGVYWPCSEVRRFAKAKYEAKEVPNKWEISSISYQD